MHLVIMAAWEGSRMRPLTDTTPKPLIQICGQTIIEHNIEPIIEHFEDIYMIVKYKKEAFPLYFGDTYKGKTIHYIEQAGEVMGTGAAILSLSGHIDGGFVIVSGDDLYEGADILALMDTAWYGALARAVDRPSDFGIFHCDASGRPQSIVEKPTDASLGNLAYIGILKLSSDIFDELRSLPLSPRRELEITDLMARQMERGEFSVVEAKGRWITIGYPWDVLKADDAIIGAYSETIDQGSTIEENVTIKGNLYIEKGVVIKSGTYIEWNAYIGDGAIIWPNAYIRGNASIGKNSKIGAFVEYKNSHMGDDSHIPHLSYIGDSIIGNHVNIGGGSKTANLRHDGAGIRVMVKEKLIDSGRRKLGAIIGDGAHLGINTLIYPGRVIPTDGSTTPGEIIR